MLTDILYYVIGGIICVFISSAWMNVEAKTLVKYNTNTGDIIQTNDVSKMPSQEILNDRFRSENTDVVLVDSKVDISKQRVDLNTKGIVDISKTELDLKEKVKKDKSDEEKLIKERMRKIAIEQLKEEGVTFKYAK